MHKFTRADKAVTIILVAYFIISLQMNQMIHPSTGFALVPSVGSARDTSNFVAMIEDFHLSAYPPVFLVMSYIISSIYGFNYTIGVQLAGLLTSLVLIPLSLYYLTRFYTKKDSIAFLMAMFYLIMGIPNLYTYYGIYSQALATVFLFVMLVKHWQGKDFQALVLLFIIAMTQRNVFYYALLAMIIYKAAQWGGKEGKSVVLKLKQYFPDSILKIALVLNVIILTSWYNVLWVFLVPLAIPTILKAKVDYLFWIMMIAAAGVLVDGRSFLPTITLQVIYLAQFVYGKE